MARLAYILFTILAFAYTAEGGKLKATVKALLPDIKDFAIKVMGDARNCIRESTDDVMETQKDLLETLVPPPDSPVVLIAKLKDVSDIISKSLLNIATNHPEEYGCLIGVRKYAVDGLERISEDVEAFLKSGEQVGVGSLINRLELNLRR